MQYRQDKQFYEDGYGTVTLTFVIADSYDELFVEADNYVSIFAVQETSETLDVGSVQREAELRFKINEATIVSTAEQDALNFTLAAADNVTRRYCATFINTGAIPDVGDLDFSGLVRPTLKASDNLWHGGEFTNAPDPIREWDFSAQPYAAQTFDEILLKDIIMGNDDDEDMIGISSAWEGMNVVDRPGWAKFNRGSSTNYYQVRHAKLINLNLLLNKLAENLALTLQNKGHGLLSINFAVTQMDCRLSPARFRTVEYSGKHGRYVRANNNQGTPNAAYSVEADDGQIVKLGTTNDELSPHISYSLVKPGNSPDAMQEKNYLLYERCKTFSDLLYAIALNFGAFLRFDYLAANSLRITFAPRSSVGAESVFVRGVTQAELTTRPLESGSAESFYGEANALAGEGDDGYSFSQDSGMYVKSVKMKDRSGTRLLLTLSPATRTAESARDADTTASNDVIWLWPHLPHNSYLLDGAAKRNAANGYGMVDTTGVTTAIYLNVPKSVEPGYADGERLYAPAAATSITVDGSVKTFFAMSDFLNYVSGRDGESFETEYDLNIPFFCSFRRSADGSHADDDGGRGSWQNLRLGRKLTLDSVDYVITSIRRNYEKVETALRLSRIGRFTAFTDSTGVPSAISFNAGIGSEPSYTTTPSAPGWLTLEAGENLNTSRLAVVKSDGKAYYATAHHAHYRLTKGVTAQSANAGEPITIVPSGFFTDAAFDFTPGAALFLRTATSGALNISESPLCEPSTNEDLYCNAAQAVTPTTIHVDFSNEFVYQPMAED